MVNKTELKFIEKIAEKSLCKVLSKFNQYTQNKLSLKNEEKKVLQAEFNLHERKFEESLLYAVKLSEITLKETRPSKKRVWYQNSAMKSLRKSLDGVFPHAARAWVLDGLIIKNQFAGIKYLVGLNNNEGAILDVLNSASSVNLGAENPWLLKMDRIEDFIGWKDNVCSAYHPGLRQAFILHELKKYYPVKKNRNKISIHMESSGTIVDSIAIESVCSYAEKVLNLKNSLVLAVDGTWAGGFGSAREATGFNVTYQQDKKAGKNLWVDRSLPLPTKDNRTLFLEILLKKIKAKGVAGIYLEPDILGDAGLITTDKKLLSDIKSIMSQYKLPMILDCVQQLGRTGSYWGENVNEIFSDFELLVITTAKSASNGQPFGMTMMPKSIEKAAYPFTQITTNQMNGPLLRVLLVAEILNNHNLQNWFHKKSEKIDKIASEEGFDLNNLYGKFLNRGIYIGENDQVKLTQLALLIEDGILVGALPNAIRFQPMLLELSQTNNNITRAIFRRVKRISNGDVSQDVKKIFKLMSGVTSGLARNNK